MKPRARRSSSLWKNILLCLATLSVLFALTEGVLRLAGYGHVVLYDPDSEALWALRPNQSCTTKVGRKRVSINEHGYRNRSFPESKPAGTRRLFVFGDSVTFGWGLEDEQTYSARLEQMLRRDDLDVLVVNAGVNAYALFQEEIAFRKAMRFAPDGAIFSSTQNEYWQDLQFLDDDGRRRVQTGVVWKNRLRHLAVYHAFGELQLAFVYSRLSRRLTQDIHGGRPADIEARSRRYAETLARIHADGVKAGVPIAFSIQPKNGQTELDPLQAVMASYAREHGIPVVDFATGFGAPGGDWFLVDDSVHPNAPAHEAIARRLEPVARDLLGRREKIPRTASLTAATPDPRPR